MSTPIQDLNSIGPADRKQEDKDERSQAQIDYDEGRGYVERGETALAAVSLHNALRGFEEEGNREGVANASNQLGHACLLRKEYDKALVHYSRAWEVCEELGDPVSLLAVAKKLVEAHEGLEDYSKALEICFYLLDRYQSNNDPQGSVDTLASVAGVYIKMGEREKAADAYLTIASIHERFKHQSIAESFREKAAELKKGAE